MRLRKPRNVPRNIRRGQRDPHRVHPRAVAVGPARPSPTHCQAPGR